ncbi:hypothetical protein GQ457_07G020000 [Hibiscus cannabinus]
MAYFQMLCLSLKLMKTSISFITPEDVFVFMPSLLKLCKVRSIQFGQKGIPYLNTLCCTDTDTGMETGTENAVPGPSPSRRRFWYMKQHKNTVPVLPDNTYDGCTIRYSNPLIKTNDTINLDLESNKIVGFINIKMLSW